MAAAANNGNTNNNNAFTEITHNNAVQALPINILIKQLHDALPSVDPFRLSTALNGLVYNKSIKANTNSSFDYLVPYPDPDLLAKKQKQTNTKRLMKLFSSFPTGIIFYFINVYLSIFNGRFTDTMFYQLLSKNIIF